MVGTLAQEVAKAKDFPTHLGSRDRKILEVVDNAKQNKITMGQATSSSGGEITIAGMTSSGQVIVTAAEALAANQVISHVIAGTGKITVYIQDTNASGAAAALNAKKVNYIVIAL
jgi:hypothetical protein